MDHAQRQAMRELSDDLHEELSEEVTVNELIAYLHARHTISAGEEQGIRRKEIALARLTAVLNLIQNKDSGWASLISFLQKAFPALANRLRSEAGEAV